MVFFLFCFLCGWEYRLVLPSLTFSKIVSSCSIENKMCKGRSKEHLGGNAHISYILCYLLVEFECNLDVEWEKLLDELFLHFYLKW